MIFDLYINSRVYKNYIVKFQLFILAVCHNIHGGKHKNSQNSNVAHALKLQVLLICSTCWRDWSVSLQSHVIPGMCVCLFFSKVVHMNLAS